MDESFIVLFLSAQVHLDAEVNLWWTFCDPMIKIMSIVTFIFLRLHPNQLFNFLLFKLAGHFVISPNW